MAGWRNLHEGEPAAITIDFAMEPDDDRAGCTATVGVDWAAGAELDDAHRWSQISGRKREPVNDGRSQLRRTLDGSADPRASQVKKLIARTSYDLDAVTTTTLGTKTDQAQATGRRTSTTGRSGVHCCWRVNLKCQCRCHPVGMCHAVVHAGRVDA